jgi:hypothetical protein
MVLQANRRQVRVAETEKSGNKRRYWDPADGMWTAPLAANASAERFYTRTKGFKLDPPGEPDEWAIYANTERLENHNPDPRAREALKANAFAGPFPMGAKTTVCRCEGWRGKNCKTWEDHYATAGLVVHHMHKDDAGDGSPVGEINILDLVARLQAEGYKIEKDTDGDNDNSQEESGA